MTGFATSVDRLINRVAHWEQSRWWNHAAPGPGSASPAAGRSAASGSSGSGASTRADLVYALVQRLADRGADAERRPRRPVPRPTDMALPDQLRVMADDLIAAAPGDDVLKLAADDIESVRRAV